ncbi:unnamed protein product [Arctia plantaginis]|uniref:Uncharacterized protein n=1 Tax=Arctia plantaginis TaxID=874455 RepID=A0A8S1BGH4_ARCPL|nr:unnamed protein product [Arctia plantaginis]CAB3261305.1 unnamed protein product [Arctia plantaginis]
MSDEENHNDKNIRGSQTVVIESASSKPVHRQPASSAAEAPTPSQKVVPTIINMSSERHKHVAKNLSASIPSKTRDSSHIGIPMGPMDTGLKRDEVVVMTAPVKPVPVLGKAASPIPSSHVKDDEKAEVDSITSEITELRTPEVVKKTPEWSDEEEASGLPRNESRASRTSRGSRVSHVVRQFFCCGLQIEAPSEENVSSPRNDIRHSGI